MSVRWKNSRVAGWGRYAAASSRVARPERQSELDRALADAGASLIARGAGKAYGDAAQNDGADVATTLRLDRLLAFDPATGVLECEAGVTFRTLLDVFVPKGFVPPVSPGTAFATVGGALAADVHGKNHDRNGSFGDHVLWFDLLCADGQTRRVSPDSHPDLFAATIGGMGLTGIVRRLAFRLLPGTGHVRVETQRIADLDAFFAAFAAARANATFSVGWIDALAQGSKLGRGVFETAEFAPAAPTAPAPKTLPVPLDFPPFALSRLSVGAFNEIYWRRAPAAKQSAVRPLDAFFYPLDRLADWNRLYGKRGFFQFQSVVPDATAFDATRKMLEAVSAAGTASFLAVLKTLGGPGRGLLSFPLRGVTLALDVPNAPGATALMATLERLALEAGGRIYLAKDALQAPAGFRASYPNLPAFEECLQRWDPQRRFASDLSRRLGIAGVQP
ncbi:MAG: FAD-binding oxidoreductase [Telmatospirillum sp.]|nr:FAD-binding oxidoreductase [Telmatospirillum sp.]